MAATDDRISRVREGAWRRREARVRRIAEAWAAYSSASSSSRSDDAVAADAPRIRRDHWPAAWSSSRRVVPTPASSSAARHVSIPNGRAAGLAAFCADVVIDSNSTQKEEAFYVVDVGAVKKLYEGFVAALPRVAPFYAVKCFPDARVVETLAACGAGFDCASETEARLASRFVNPRRDVIFANPCKRPSDVRHLLDAGIRWTTFDSATEVHKIAEECSRQHNTVPPPLELVLRLRADDPNSKLPFGAKYGATLAEVPALLEAAQQSGLTVAGVSFHVGSGARTSDAYRAAIKAARGLPLATWSVLDIGGGLCGDFRRDGSARVSAAGDEAVVEVINAALDEFFPVSEFPELRIIAEPGRYFAESAAALCCPVVGRRDRAAHRDVWIADGVYGAFNAILYDKAEPHAVVLKSRTKKKKNGSQEQDDASPPPETLSVWGPTCDSLDCVFADVRGAPRVDLGDWLLFVNFGAYTLAGASDFNGIPATRLPVWYVESHSMAYTDRDAADIDGADLLLYSATPPMEVVRHF